MFKNTLPSSRLLAAAALLCLAPMQAVLATAAPATTPLGVWRTIDDKTKEPKSLVRITSEADGEYSGRVEKFLRPGADPKRTCTECSDERKNQPILGMKILWKTRADGDEYSGKILDPENGKTYDAKLKLIDGGMRMEVRGYVGVTLLGRTQIWTREAAS